VDDLTKKTVVVLGDWFIDENWVVSRQKLYHSSHTGDIHFQSRHKDLGRKLISLCGAAEIMESLSSYFKSRRNYKFVGIGAWNPLDDDLLRCVLCTDHEEKKYLSPFTVAGLKEPSRRDANGNAIDPPKLPKCSYVETMLDCQFPATLCNIIKSTSGQSVDASTNRIVRCYEGFRGGEPHLLYRFDWILPVPADCTKLRKLDELLIEAEVKGCDETHSDVGLSPLTAMIIEDHDMGVMNSIPTEDLTNLIGDQTKVFIRTKIHNPPWLLRLVDRLLERDKPKKLDLLVVDYKLADHVCGKSRWFYGSHLGRVVCEFFDELLGPVVDDGERRQSWWQRAAVLLDDNRAVGKDGSTYYGISKPAGPKQLINIGRTTVFFGALVAQLLEEKEKDFGTVLDNSLNNAFSWTEKASKLWSDQGPPNFYPEYQRALSTLPVGPSPKAKGPCVNETDLRNDWADSSNNIGTITIKENQRRVLQLWRGEGTLENYICVGNEKRKAVNRLVSVVSEFEGEKEPSQQLGCLLTASPGWGKSFLASCLAQYLKMEYLEFSVAQMSTTRDFVDCLAAVSSVQNRTRRRLLVFIDEVNACIGGQEVLGLLLGPLWDGVFFRDGRSYRLDPAAWIFASTSPLSEFDDIGKKGSDFVSRLNGPIIDLDALSGGAFLTEAVKVIRQEINKYATGGEIDYQRLYDLHAYKAYSGQEEANELRTEQVYLMTALLTQKWGPIRRIQTAVLDLFRDTLPVNGVRSLQFFASRFQEVRGGEITIGNVPDMRREEALRRHLIVPRQWWENSRELLARKLKSDGKLDWVEIETITK
jgi:hypothetical protein